MATFDYTSRDFLSIRQDLINRASRMIPEWGSDDASDFANVFVDLWAYTADILHFYIDRAASETFLETATQRESVLAIANLMDYIPASSRAARGSITLSINSVPVGTTTYTIPQYTTFSGTDSDGNILKFYLNEASTAASAGQQYTGTVVQGEIVSGESLGKSSGFVNQKINLLKKGVDTDSISVLVYEGPLSGGVPTAVEYQYVAQLSTAGYLAKVFTARLTSDGYTQIIFGNGFNGFIPTTNAEITASYRTTSGSVGNVPANSITVVGAPASTYIGVVSSTALTGGADVESIESIRGNVSRLYRTQDRAVSLQDYKDLTLQIPGVSKATATYTPATAGASFTGSVTLYPVPHQTSYPPTTTSGSVVIEIPTSMSESIESYFSTRSMLGVTASVTNPVNVGSIDKYIECVPVYVGVTVNVLPNYVQSWVKDEVDAAIRDLLSFQNVSFGQTLSVGQVYRAALSVTGVDYVDVTKLSLSHTATTATNIVGSSTKLLCFTDAIGTPARTAISLNMVGGITGTT